MPRVRPAARRSALASRDTNATDTRRGAHQYPHMEHLILGRTDTRKYNEALRLLMTPSTGVQGARMMRRGL